MSSQIIQYHGNGSPFSNHLSNQDYRRMSLSVEGRPSKKPRASRPKVKSGCITCKTRRVKCDENKPSCLRCQKFGRKCDGYAPEAPATRGLSQLQPRIPIGNPSVSIHATEAESQYFRVFAECTAYELSGFFEPEFWTRLVLQESHNVAAIRHAVIALGALNKSLDAASEPHLKVNVIQSIDKKHHEQAVFQHIKAIQALNQYISFSKSPQLRSALIACLLFICFETFQGSYASSVQQTYGGLKILRTYYAGKPGSRPWIPGPPAQSKGRQKISQALLEREGCDHVFNEVAIVNHVEEYLDNESNLQVNSASKGQGCHCIHQAELVASAVYDPSAEHVEIPARQMGGRNFNNKEQQGAKNVYSARRNTRKPTNESPEAATGKSPDSSWQTITNSRKGSRSTTLSNTIAVSRPVADTPPSTGPHTPSPSRTSHPSPTQLTTSSSCKRPLTSRSPTPLPLLQNDVSIEEILIQSFVRLDGQGLFFGMIPGIPPLYWDIHNVWQLPIPTTFPTFHSAQRCWDFLMDRALQFYRRTTFNRAYAPMSSDSPASIAKQYAFHMNALNKFATSFQPILSAAISPDDNEILNPAALILSLYLKCTSIILATIPQNSEMLYDSFLSDFKYIVKTCSLLISAQERTQLPKNPRFSFDVGVVPPLHVTAMKCRDPATRRAAIKLLFESPRQEGMWDGVLSARIGRWIVAVEEEGLPLSELDLDTSAEKKWPGAEFLEPAQSSYGYPSPPDIVDERCLGGEWQDGNKISDVVNQMAGNWVYKFGDEWKLVKSVGMKAAALNSKTVARGLSTNNGRVKGPETASNKGWVVPEENRVQLMVVDFHIPDRYIKVKCQRAVLNKDGTREERETVIAW